MDELLKALINNEKSKEPDQELKMLYQEADSLLKHITNLLPEKQKNLIYRLETSINSKSEERMYLQGVKTGAKLNNLID